MRNNKLFLYSALLLILSMVSSFYDWSVGLGDNKKHRLSEYTLELIADLDEELYIELFLEGNLPQDFIRLREASVRKLKQYQKKNNRIVFEITNPDDRLQELTDLGAEISNLTVEENGIVSEQVIVPGIKLTYKGKSKYINLLSSGSSPFKQIENSIAQLEYHIDLGIQRSTQQKRKKIAVITGDGQSSDLKLYDMLSSIREDYYLAKFTLDSVKVNPKKTINQLSDFDLILMSNPKRPLGESKKYALDLYLNQGGSIIYTIDFTLASMDSLLYDGRSMSMNSNLDLTDLFFSYGLRIKPGLVKDYYNSKIPVITGQVNGEDTYQNLSWPFHPLGRPASEHPIVNRMQTVNQSFVNPIELIENQGSLSYYPLLQSSEKSEISQVPGLIELESLLEQNPNLYQGGPYMTAVLVEGQFPSAYSQRTTPFDFKANPKPGKLILISDGNIFENLSRDGQPLALGYLPWSGNSYENKSFALSCIDYLSESGALYKLKTRSFKVSELDAARAYENQGYYKFLSIAIPLLFALMILFAYFRFNKPN